MGDITGHCHTPEPPWLWIKAALGPCTHRLAPWSTLQSASFLLTALLLYSMRRKTHPGKKTSTWQGSFMLCPLVNHPTLLVGASQAQKKQQEGPPHLPHRHTKLQGWLNPLSDTHYFILVFPLHFGEVHAVVVGLRLQFLSFFILASKRKKKKKIQVSG